MSINSKLDSIDKKLTTIRTNEPQTFEAGVEAGKKAEYDAFWDAFQENGSRTSYAYAFCRTGWTDKIYKPKHKIVATGNFEQCYRETKITTITNIDTSGVTSFLTSFYNCSVQSIDKLDFSSATNTQNTFAHSTKIHTIGELVSSEITVWHTSTFQNCYALANMTIVGEIATNFTCTTSALTPDSLMSIIKALKDFSEDTSGTTHKITIGNANISKLTTDELGLIQQKGWDYA